MNLNKECNTTNETRARSEGRPRLKTWLLAFALVLCAGAAMAQIGPGPFAGFPSLNTTDGRFIGFGCAGIATFESSVSLQVAIPADQASFTLSFFDGDTGGLDGAAKRHWDLGTRQLVYSLYADPLRQGSALPANLIGTWKGNDTNPLVDPDPGHPTPLWTASAAKMPDNAWWGATITSSLLAQAPSGNYFYILQIGLDGACAPAEQTEANIKIAASNPLSFLVPRFGLVAALRQTANDGPIIYPGTFPPPGNDFVHAPTTYDGTFQFFFKLPGGETDLRIYDGDFDLGTNSLVGLPSGTVLSPCADANDADTPFDYNGFPFSTAGALPEGVNSPGSPVEDNNLDAFRRGEPGNPGRVGCVRYEVTDPQGTVYRDDNPSGNLEWEQFRIATPSAVNPGDSDYVTAASPLPAGIWSIKLIGLDLSNLNFMFADACATRFDGATTSAACPDLATFLLGDTVWLDKNGNGLQDADEPGVPGVTVNLLKAGTLDVVSSAVTGDSQQTNWIACTLHNTGLDTQGLYCLGVDEPGDYLVQIAPENFLPGGALAGLSSTTGGESQTHTVGNDNLLIYDFGYRGTGRIGDRVWLDVNGDGIQDAGESGLNGVTVQLLDGAGNLLATLLTSGDGNYNFYDLPGGTYRVVIDASTLPAGAVPTFDLDGIGTANSAVVTLPAGATRTEVDFGYRGTAVLGDRLWYDINADGFQDVDESGLNGVTVELLDNLGNLLRSTVTSGDGGYSFTGLLAGTYSVRVNAATLPAGASPTFDADGTATPDIATVSLTDGQTRTDIDFGYRGTAAVGDRVWFDIDGNGLQDSGEMGINGVTVELLSTQGNVLRSTVTSGDGAYSFAGLLQGTYSVRIAAATLPGGAVETFDLNGTGTADTAVVTLAAGQNLVTCDFGYRGTAALGDRVWLDLNSNGAQEAGEPGINGVAVEILDAGGHILASTTTTSNGLYGFANLLAATYTVRVVTATLPSGVVPTYDLDGTGTPSSAVVTLSAGSNRSDVDFGYRGTLQFGDRVWFDFDGNGIQDTGEPGINGVTITLKDSAGTPIATTTTSGNGNYAFTNLPAGNYTVNIVPSSLPGGTIATYDLDGAATPNVTAVTLNAGQSRTDVDFGYRGNSSLGDHVWLDFDADGAHDAGEVGINGVTVQLLDANGNVIAATVTAGDGNYSFANLLPGTYKVKIITSTLMAGAIQTYDLDGTATASLATVAVAAGQNRVDVDFGYRVTPPGTATIGYWKTHASAWPVTSIKIGSVVYTRDQAIALFDTPSRGDKSIDLFKQLVAAKLNLIAGNNPSCIYSTVSSADAWMVSYPPGSNVGGSSAAWTTASPWHTQLDNYNNGALCAPHRN